MQAVEITGKAIKPIVKRAETKDEYRLSEELKRDLQDAKNMEDLVGPFDNLAELRKELDL